MNIKALISSLSQEEKSEALQILSDEFTPVIESEEDMMDIISREVKESFLRAQRNYHRKNKAS